MYKFLILTICVLCSFLNTTKAQSIEVTTANKTDLPKIAKAVTKNNQRLIKRWKDN